MSRFAHAVSIKNLPPRYRPRERLRDLGAVNLTSVELVSIVLGSGTIRHPVKQLARLVVDWLAKHPTHDRTLLPNDLKALQKIPGIGQVAAGRILACLELGRRLAAPPTTSKLNSPQTVLPFVEALRQHKQEHLLALYLNGRQELILQQTIAIGGLNLASIEAREVFAPALTLPAAFLILAHNHPSGDPTPSDDDLKLTSQLQQAGQLLGVNLIDHLIIGRENYFSFKEAGSL